MTMLVLIGIYVFEKENSRLYKYSGDLVSDGFLGFIYVAH